MNATVSSRLNAALVYTFSAQLGDGSAAFHLKAKLEAAKALDRSSSVQPVRVELCRFVFGSKHFEFAAAARACLQVNLQISVVRMNTRVVRTRV